jgi:transcriptional regulator with XRE-family HTH domain
MSEQLAKALQERLGDRSLRALARDLGVAVGTAEGWLKGWRTPDIKHISRLAVYLGVDPSVIVDWEIAASVTLHNVDSGPWLPLRVVRPTDNRPYASQAA